MKRAVLCVTLFCVLIVAAGCGGKRSQIVDEPAARPSSAMQVRVVDVSNRTGEIFDVDVIGLLWSALDASLHNRGALWTGNPATSPLLLEATILNYEKGNVILRNLVPFTGKTEIKVRSTLRDGEKVIATVETHESISIGREGLSFKAWQKIFQKAAEETVNQLIR
jgi:hypothetical protein